MNSKAQSLSAKKRAEEGFKILLLIIVLLVLFVLALGSGRTAVNFFDVIQILLAQFNLNTRPIDESAQTVVTLVRLPRITAAILVGSALAISGAAYQGLFRNPMVSPDILGASAGAGFGAALALLFMGNTRVVQVSAFIMGFIAVMITYLSARKISKGVGKILIFVLCGLIVGTLFQAMISAIKFTADPDSKLPEITYWLMGSIAKVTWNDLLIFLVPYCLGLIPLLLFRWRLNSLAFGDVEAEALGVHVERLRMINIVCATLLTSSVVAIAGIIGWVGLIIPHIARFLFGPDNRIVLPASLLIGASFLVLVDICCRTFFASEIPLGILTSVIGAPFFFIILIKTQGDKL